MGMKEAIVTCFSKYATTAGRARRSEYWYFYLFNMIVGAVLSFIGVAIGITFLSSIYSLATIIPTICVTVRRLHDIGKSGVWILISLIPVVGLILMIVWTCTDSVAGANEFGENPKGYTF